MIKSFKIFEQLSLEDKFLDACRNGVIKVAKELLDNGVDPSDLLDDGDSDTRKECRADTF